MADIQYNAPRCLINRTTGGGRNLVSLDNRLGTLRAIHDLLEGNALQFILALDNQQRSCKLCQLAPDQYCTTVLGNASQLRLAYDTSYNFQVVAMLDDGEVTTGPVARTWMLASAEGEDDAAATISMPVVFKSLADNNRSNNVSACGHTLRLVVTALVNIERPIARDLMLVAEQQPDHVMPCVPGSGGRIAPLDCRTARQFYYVALPVYNCLGEITTTEAPAPNNDPIYYSTYYYYYQAWLPETVPTPPLHRRTLCGESWRGLFLRTRLDRYCNQEVQLHVALKPWYEAALEAMTAYLDKRYSEPALWLLLNTLERTCALRDSTGQVGLNDTIFAAMLRALRRGDADGNNVVNGKETVCEWMALQEPLILSPAATSSDLETISRVLNVTLPAYLGYLDRWYFAVFKYVVPPDATLPRHAILLSLIAWIVLGLVLVSVAFTTYHVFFRPSEYTLNHNNAYQIIH